MGRFRDWTETRGAAGRTSCLISVGWHDECSAPWRFTEY